MPSNSDSQLHFNNVLSQNEINHIQFRFLIDYCEPKLGSADTMSWLLEIELKRKEIVFNRNLFQELSKAEQVMLFEGRMVNKILSHLLFGKVQVLYVETALSGLAFTFSIDEVELPRTGGEGFSGVNLLDAAVAGVGHSLRCLKGYQCAADTILHSLFGMCSIGEKEKKKEKDRVLNGDSVEGVKGESLKSDSHSHRKYTGTDSDNESLDRRQERVGVSVSAADLMTSLSDSSNSNSSSNSSSGSSSSSTSSSGWLGAEDVPLLSMPLLDCIVLILSLTHSSVLSEGEDVVHESLEAIVRSEKAHSLGYSAAGQCSLRSEMASDYGGFTALFRPDRDGDRDRGEGEKVGQKTCKDKDKDEDESFYYTEVPGAVCAAVRWLCIANLVQLMISEIVQGQGQGQCGTMSLNIPVIQPISPSFSLSAPSVEKKRGGGGDSEVIPNPNPNPNPKNNDTVSNDEILSGWAIGKLCQTLLEVVYRESEPEKTTERGVKINNDMTAFSTRHMRSGAVLSVLTRWTAFLRAVVHMLSICRPDLIALLSTSKSSGKSSLQSVSKSTCYFLVSYCCSSS